MTDLLFYRMGDLSSYLEERKRTLKNELESFDPNYLLNVSEQDLFKYLVEKYSVEPLVLHEDKIYVANQSEVDIDVSQDQTRYISNRNSPFYIKGFQITIAIPFDGDGELFQYKPSTFTFNPPRGEIVCDEVHLTYQRVDHNPEKLKRTYMGDVRGIREYLNWTVSNIEEFNKSLESFIKPVIGQRKKKILDDQNLVSALGIPIKERDDLPQTYAVPTVRKKPKIERPKVTTEPFKPEPSLSTEEYENILKILYNMALVMERSPKTFSKLKEEEIRDHFLMHLNGHYEGQATGETFNYSGKTDILIRVEGKNIFIAECKIWRGEKHSLRTIHQLLGYASWRDTKTAILLFNRNKDFSAVLQKIPSTVRSHSCYKRDYEIKGETVFRYIFHQPNDANRELTISVMAFNVPS